MRDGEGRLTSKSGRVRKRKRKDGERHGLLRLTRVGEGWGWTWGLAGVRGRPGCMGDGLALWWRVVGGMEWLSMINGCV